MGRTTETFTADTVISSHTGYNNNKRKATQYIPTTKSKVPPTKKATTSDMEAYQHLSQQFQQMQAEISGLRQEIDLVKELQHEIVNLKSRLNAALLENEQLKKQKNNPINNNNINSNSTSPTQHTPSLSTLDSQWNNVTKKNLGSQKQNKNTQNTQKKFKSQQKPTKKQLTNPTEGMLNWAYRGFTENTGPTGYQFIHFKNPARTNQRTVRKRLAIIGISNRRVLAVQFPTKGVISLLVHNAYAEEIKASLAKGKVTPMTFNPHHESVICDPKHATLSVTQKQEMATDIYHNRMLKLCLAMQPAHVGSSIIRYFNQVEDKFYLPDEIVQQFFDTRAESQQKTNSSAQTQEQKEADLNEDLREGDFMSDSEPFNPQ